jgi:hypothetical protein
MSLFSHVALEKMERGSLSVTTLLPLSAIMFLLVIQYRMKKSTAAKVIHYLIIVHHVALARRRALAFYHIHF